MRVLHEEFSSIELESRVQRITKVKSRPVLECPVQPYVADNPLPEVMWHICLFAFCSACMVLLLDSLVCSENLQGHVPLLRYPPRSETVDMQEEGEDAEDPHGRVEEDDSEEEGSHLPWAKTEEEDAEEDTLP